MSNNTDKLLRAFIEASGYEVEEIKSTSNFYGTGYVNKDGSLKEGAIPAGKVESIDYKVTKKMASKLTPEDITSIMDDNDIDIDDIKLALSWIKP
jgi:hypothetical protein